MKLHRNQKKILLLLAVAILGMLLNIAPDMLQMRLGIGLPMYFLGTVLVTILCGTFPGMLSAAGGMILQFVIFAVRFDIEAAGAIAPPERVLYGVLLAIVIGKFIQREAYRKPWMALPGMLLGGMLVALLSQAISILNYSFSVFNETAGMEGFRRVLAEITAPDNLLALLTEAGTMFLSLAVAMAVSLAVCQLLPEKWREALRNISWMMKPLPPAAARRIQKTNGKGYGHSLRSRITLLVTVAVFFSSLFILLISVNSTMTLVNEEFSEISHFSAEYASALITPEMAAEIEQKGAEAEGYAQTREKLQNLVDSNNKLTGLCVLRATDEGIRVLFDVADGEFPVQNAGEFLGDSSFAGKVLSLTAEELNGFQGGYRGSGSNMVYRSTWPVFPETISGDPDLPEEQEQPDALFSIVSYIRAESASSYGILFVLRMAIEFSGFFILLLSFGFWISRYYMIYPIASMSERADQISGKLENISDLEKNIAEMNDLSIHTADETETLYKAICQMALSLSARMKSMQLLFGGTVTALVNAIDAKDQYTRGHSSRVAEYSRRIAELAGKSKEECEKIYLSALVHDIGKIGISGDIINKKGRLTDDEYKVIKEHPQIGYQILSEITEYPYLNIAAHFHHERYDGRGYPEGLKGEEIPEIARIIAVADAYDAMTSNRSYRNAIPQHLVREELVKGCGTQFDPQFARCMIRMIDHDTEYKMQETRAENEKPAQQGNAVHDGWTEGWYITEEMTRISLCSRPDEEVSGAEGLPVLIAYDSLDGEVHPGEENNRNLLYHEYARIRLDGQVTEYDVRKSEVRMSECRPDMEQPSPESGLPYRIEAFRRRDHAMIRIAGADGVREVILALPDNSRFLYLAVSADRCTADCICAKKDESPCGEEIPRIAEEISYIKGCPEGDIPNLEADAWRTAATDGIPIPESMQITFHAMSLPTARMVWHCPFVSVFSSEDGKVNGPDFREYILLRLDGESSESDEHARNKIDVGLGADFEGWKDWKDRFKEGLDCSVTVRREGRRIYIQTENMGVAVRSETTILDKGTEVLLALTGDQCAITDIHIARGQTDMGQGAS